MKTTKKHTHLILLGSKHSNSYSQGQERELRENSN